MTSIAGDAPDPESRPPVDGRGELQCYQNGVWLDHWTVGCPDGLRQRRETLLGYRLTAIDCLQVRVALGDRDHGVCQMLIEQSPDRISMSAFACGEHAGKDAPHAQHDVGCRIWLDRPLGARIVVDIDSGVALPWLHMREGHLNPRVYVPRPAGKLWPSDGL